MTLEVSGDVGEAALLPGAASRGPAQPGSLRAHAIAACSLAQTQPPKTALSPKSPKVSALRANIQDGHRKRKEDNRKRKNSWEGGAQTSAPRGPIGGPLDVDRQGEEAGGWDFLLRKSPS